MPYSYKGSLSIGFVYIPIVLQKAAKETAGGFNMLDKKTMSRIKYKKTCVDCDGREIAQGDIVKGYEYEKGKYVVFTDADFEKLKSQKDKNITIEQFADISEIDPVYYDTPYYVIPTGGERPFALLLRAMEESGKVGIAKTVLGNKETLIAIRAKNGQLLLNTLFFYSEIQKNPAKDIKQTVNDNELKLCKSLVEMLSAPFEPQNFTDEYSEKLQKAVEDKVAGKEIAVKTETEGKKISDLMEALQKSILSFDSKPVRKTEVTGVRSQGTGADKNKKSVKRA